MLFEGPEKKLEVMAAIGGPSLRDLGRDFWESVVESSGAAILSRISNATSDAYLLSESSLFVSERRAVMITCGRTTLVAAAAAILDRVPVTALASLIYERKNENFPQLQRTTFAEDVAALRERTTGTDTIFGDPEGDNIRLFHLDRDCRPAPDDETLEVLMYDIDPVVSTIFVPTATSAVDLRRRVGLTASFPDFAVDDYFFEPQGYSYNGLDGDTYVTLHVTPQTRGSYVSFETNARLGAAAQRALLDRLLGCFRPARCDLLLFQGRIDPEGIPSGFALAESSRQALGCGYDVAYAHVCRLETGAR